jgi:hypothetical protein
MRHESLGRNLRSMPFLQVGRQLVFTSKCFCEPVGLTATISLSQLLGDVTARMSTARECQSALRSGGRKDTAEWTRLCGHSGLGENTVKLNFKGK